MVKFTKRIRRYLKVGTITTLLLGLPTAAFALDLSFLEGLTGPISQITQIDQDYLNSGLVNLQAAQRLFRNGDFDQIGGALTGELGRLGIPDTAVSAIQGINPNDNLGDNIENILLDRYHRSAQVQDHVRRVLGRQGQEVQARELGQTDALKQVATDVLENSQQLSRQSNFEAQQAESEALAANNASAAAQQCRASQCVLKQFSTQFAHASNQNANLSQQLTALSTNISTQSAQVSALANQNQIAAQQRARLTSIAAFQMQSMDAINGELVALNYGNLNDAKRNAEANRSATFLMVPNLPESFE